MDLNIILLLFNNSRLTYREISDFLGLSVNAIYKRIQALIELKTINRFTASLKPYAINSLYTFIFGQCNSQDMERTIQELGNHENTWQIILSSRNYMYIGAMLENIHQLEPYTAFIAKTALMQAPKVGLLSNVQYKAPIPYIIPKSSSMQYDQLDQEIIRSLRYDSRKPIAEIAEDINRTSNTVRRRLNRLINEGIIDLSIQFNPEASKDIFALFQITLPPYIEKIEFAKYLNEKYHPHLFYIWSFSNLPSLILCWVWVNSMKEFNDLIENVKREKIESLLFDIMYKVYYFETWKEKLVQD